MSDIDLSTFPDNRIEGIALLYVQKKNYDNPTPTQLAEDYMNAHKQISDFFSKHRRIEDWR